MILNPAQIKLLRVLAQGGCFYAALREPDDFARDDIIFSEAVGIIVHPRLGCDPTERYRIRNRTAGPLYLADPSLVNCETGDSGLRQFKITPTGLRALQVH